MAIVDVVFKVVMAGLALFLIPFCLKFYKLVEFAIKNPIVHSHAHSHKHEDVKVTRNVPKEHMAGL